MPRAMHWQELIGKDLGVGIARLPKAAAYHRQETVLVEPRSRRIVLVVQ